jgi:hypothetical protein
MILGPSDSQSSNRCLIKQPLRHGTRLHEGRKLGCSAVVPYGKLDNLPWGAIDWSANRLWLVSFDPR